jgi:hypothetical protein
MARGPPKPLSEGRVGRADGLPRPPTRGWRQTRPWSQAIALSLLVTMVMPTAAAHGSGSQAIGARGSFLLTPAGTSNNTLHVYLTDFGLPIDQGDTLRFSWASENGSGPPIYFELHSHPQTAFVILYQQEAPRDNGTWTVPKTEPYMVFWLNRNNVSVNVTYSFTLFPPPPSLALLILFFALSSAPFTLIAIAAVWWFARRRRRQAAPPSP